jgi:hypothetical protein
LSTVLLCSIGIIFLFSCSPERKIPYHEPWTKKDFRKANTAKFAFYLSKKSKETIRLMNLARMDGPLFAKTYYIPYLIDKRLMAGKEDTVVLHKKPYYSGLYTDLNMHKKLPLLKPSFSLHLSASFHSITSGLSGYSGHDKPLPFGVRFRIFNFFINNYGENCDYGNKYPLDAIFSLLIDEDVSMVGHRRNILSKSFRRVGCSFKWHRGYGHNYVQDFSSGNLFQRMFKKKV